MVCSLKDMDMSPHSNCIINSKEHYKTQELALQTPIMSYKDGVGCSDPNGNKIDSDSFLKYSSMLTHFGGKNHLPHVGMLTVPYMGCGVASVDYNARPEFEYTFAPKSTLNRQPRNRFVPLVGVLANEIQNPVHIIPEDNDDNWIRGGFPSRKCKYTKRF